MTRKKSIPLELFISRRQTHRQTKIYPHSRTSLKRDKPNQSILKFLVKIKDEPEPTLERERQ